MVVPSSDVAFSIWLISDSSCLRSGSRTLIPMSIGDRPARHFEFRKVLPDSRTLAGEDLTPFGLRHGLHVLRDGLRQRGPRPVLLDGHDGAHDLVRVHLDEVPRLGPVDAHEELTGGSHVVDVA